MSISLLGLHAWMGEFAAFLFAWAFIELLTGQRANVRRARLAALAGIVFIFGAWSAGGFYYVEIYGSEVKPFIEEGPWPWAHQAVMETREHVFLFLPFLSVLAFSIMPGASYENCIYTSADHRKPVRLCR